MRSVPFTVEVEKADIDDLRRRIRSTRWPDDVGNTSWTYGVEKAWLGELVHHWAEVYDWRQHEAEINHLDNRMAVLDGVPLHYVHAPGRGPSPIPLILTHGWPWTFWDYHLLIGPLSDPAAHGGDPADAFDVVVPSLPGFGFSAPLRTTGIGVRRIAELWVRLMRDVLGYDRFGAAGGDWGAIITYELGHAHPDQLVGCHLSLPIVLGTDPRELTSSFASDEKWMLDRMQAAAPTIRSHRAVYNHDPQTLAYALTDSPVGTAAWLWERRHAWADHDGDVQSVFDADFLCTTASIYWLTRTVASSGRLYREHKLERWSPVHGRMPQVEVPTGYAVFPKELVFVPRSVAASHTDLRRWTIMPRGGHFGPAEEPDALVEELRSFYRELRRS